MADEAWQKPVKELKTDLGKARKDIDDIKKLLEQMNRSLDTEMQAIYDQIDKQTGNLDKRLTEIDKRLDKELGDIQKRLKAVEGRVA